jgi:hypothetical protein
MEIQTTNIDSLPMQTSGKEEQVQLIATEKQNPTVVNSAPNDKLNENEFITGLQKASSTGMTSLSSRDIPIDQTVQQQDIETKANYIPQSQGDYITQHQTTEEIIKQNTNKHLEKSKFDYFYNEFGIPILIIMVYFMYQLPAVRKLFLTTFPGCYTSMGEVNLTGRLVNAVFFGAITYAITKILTNISE